MLNDEQIRVLKERCENHGDIYMRDGRSGCLAVRGVRLTGAPTVADPESAGPVALVGSGQVVSLHTANITDFVTLTPWDGSSKPSAWRDNLTLLQDAARSGLDVDFMTGDVRLPKETPLPPDPAA